MRITVIYFEYILLAFFINCLCLTASEENATSAKSVRNKLFWYNHNYELIKRKINFFNLKPENLVRVKNVILFVGDGMGLSTITASRVYKKQLSSAYEDTKLTFDSFPTSALIQTETENTQISESAAAATALFCGVKTNFESLGVDATARKDECYETESQAKTSSIMTWAQQQNLRTGFVTTARITHATPAALYAHSKRHFEDDSKSESKICKDIARQLVENEPGMKLNVIFGGGMRSFHCGTGGRRKDCRNLTSEWLESHPSGEFVTDRSSMLNISSETDHVLGIFGSSHMHFNHDRDPETEPSLAEMTSSAIKVLKKRKSNGFLLVVEGGKIDLAHHYNNAFRALDDTLALDKAVEVALKSVDLSESMIIVTSDHASAMTFSGYATPKDTPILGLDKFVSNVDKKPYQILTYSSGLGHEKYDEAVAKLDFKNSYHKSCIPSTWSNHAADDVPLYATGALSNLLFSGTLDQTYIPHAIAFAMCLFRYRERCIQKPIAQYPHTPSKIFLLKQKVQEEKLREQLKEVELEKSIEKSSENISISDASTSDLIGNATQLELEEDLPSSAPGLHASFHQPSIWIVIFVTKILNHRI